MDTARLGSIALVAVLAARAPAQEPAPSATATTRPVPAGPATVVVPAPAATDGLEVTLDLHDREPKRTNRFASLQEATLWMRSRTWRRSRS